MFDKLLKFAKRAGLKLVYLALLLFYTLQKSTTPPIAKSIIIGGLGYFILPFDIIPDIIPLVGFSDDLTALFSVLVAVALYIDDEVKFKAKDKLKDWFGSYDGSELKDVDQKIKG